MTRLRINLKTVSVNKYKYSEISSQFISQLYKIQYKLKKNQ